MCKEYLTADCISVCFSFDLVFSNWLLMYLDEAEVFSLFSKMLTWLRPGGYFFFRESCFHQSGFYSRYDNSPRLETQEKCPKDLMEKSFGHFTLTVCKLCQSVDICSCFRRRVLQRTLLATEPLTAALQIVLSGASRDSVVCCPVYHGVMDVLMLRCAQ